MYKNVYAFVINKLIIIIIIRYSSESERAN